MMVIEVNKDIYKGLCDITGYGNVSSIIVYKGILGLAIQLGEAFNYKAGTIVVFWDDGKITVLPEDESFHVLEFDILNSYLVEGFKRE